MIGPADALQQRGLRHYRVLAPSVTVRPAAPRATGLAPTSIGLVLPVGEQCADDELRPVRPRQLRRERLRLLRRRLARQEAEEELAHERRGVVARLAELAEPAVQHHLDEHRAERT